MGGKFLEFGIKLPFLSLIYIWHKELTWVPVKTLAGRQVRDLTSLLACGFRQSSMGKMGLTSRGGPSGSPMLMTVLSSLANAEPNTKTVNILVIFVF